MSYDLLVQYTIRTNIPGTTTEIMMKSINNNNKHLITKNICIIKTTADYTWCSHILGFKQVLIPNTLFALI